VLPREHAPYLPLYRHDEGCLGDPTETVQTRTEERLDENCRRRPPLQSTPHDEPLSEPLTAIGRGNPTAKSFHSQSTSRIGLEHLDEAGLDNQILLRLT
jgi:hypothetical protein